MCRRRIGYVAVGWVYRRLEGERGRGGGGGSILSCDSGCERAHERPCEVGGARFCAVKCTRTVASVCVSYKCYIHVPALTCFFSCVRGVSPSSFFVFFVFFSSFVFMPQPHTPAWLLLVVPWYGPVGVTRRGYLQL